MRRRGRGHQDDAAITRPGIPHQQPADNSQEEQNDHQQDHVDDRFGGLPLLGLCAHTCRVLTQAGLNAPSIVAGRASPMSIQPPTAVCGLRSAATVQQSGNRSNAIIGQVGDTSNTDLPESSQLSGRSGP